MEKLLEIDLAIGSSNIIAKNVGARTTAMLVQRAPSNATNEFLIEISSRNMIDQKIGKSNVVIKSSDRRAMVDTKDDVLDASLLATASVLEISTVATLRLIMSSRLSVVESFIFVMVA